MSASRQQQQYSREDLVALGQGNLPSLTCAVYDTINSLEINVQSSSGFSTDTRVRYTEGPVKGSYKYDAVILPQSSTNNKQQVHRWERGGARTSSYLSRGGSSPTLAGSGRFSDIGLRGGIGGRGGRGSGATWTSPARGGYPVTLTGSRTLGRPFSLDTLFDIQDADDLTLEVLKNFETFKDLMESDRPVRSLTEKFLKILARITPSQFHKEGALKILHAASSSRFLDHHVSAAILSLDSLSAAEESHDSVVVEVVELILQLVSSISRKLPTFASKASLLLNYLTEELQVVLAIRRTKPSLEKDLLDLTEECRQSSSMVQRDSVKVKEKKRGPCPNEDDETPPDNFRRLSIFPDCRDDDWAADKPFLRANKAEGAFLDDEHYLDVHFRLLREDYIQPLRKGIKEYQQMKLSTDASKTHSDLRFYDGVQIVGIECTDKLHHILRFDKTDLRHVKWKVSKRLQFGSLVCLSSNDFENIYFAVVSNRQVQDLQRGIIHVTFEKRLQEILQVPSTESFTMAETTAFFEAYRHVLEGLRCTRSVPFNRYIVECQQDVNPPKYLLKSGSSKLNLSTILKSRCSFDDFNVSVLTPRAWPKVEETTMNESQLEAVKTALTKELAIIQGPPGTGKTFVGLKVVEVLLNNRLTGRSDFGGKPILIVCYSNHALDQFLEGILEFCDEGIVRVGSRCKNEALKSYNLKECRMKNRKNYKYLDISEQSILANVFSWRNILKSRGEQVENHAARSQVLNQKIIRESALRENMLPGQYNSLTGFHGRAIFQRRAVMADWLVFGRMICQQDTLADPYTLIEKDVISQILHHEVGIASGVDLGNVMNLRPKIRVQLYRSWLQKAQERHQLETDDGGRRLRRSHGRTLLEISKTKILPDDVLRPVVDANLYSTITSSIRQEREAESSYCVRAWLGVHRSSPGLMTQVWENMHDTCDVEDVTAATIISVPRADRVQMYRSWVTKLMNTVDMEIQHGKKKGRVEFSAQNLRERARSTILSDHDLEPVIRQDLLQAIKHDMLQRLEQQSRFCIRAWLGLDEFSRDPELLESLLEQLRSTEETIDAAKDEDTTRRQNNDGDDDESDDDERQLDDDETKNFFRRNRTSYANKVVAVSRFEAPFYEEEGGWTVPSSTRRNLHKKVQHLLKTARPMEKTEASSVTDVWDPNLTLEDRVRLYLFWAQQYQKQTSSSLQRHADDFVQESKLYQELRFSEDCQVLRQASVIGMTTTGAARYHKVLAKIGCPIVILEEAAEVLEAHVVTTLSQSCQHLILIGDHQQLRPSPTVYDLCRHYQLDLSLFERLVNNKLHHTTLTVQHRMRPEVSRLVRHVYPDLKDHPSTLDRPHIRGIKEDVFLFHHVVAESTQSETRSKSNVHEAELCVGLCRYLLQQGYSPKSITILAAYTGQLLVFKSLMQDKSFKDVHVTAVDNYQGEENDVIILSLVRSNEQGNVGFLGTDNRVCVALSRARNGLYAFGNFKILSEKSDLWKNVVRTAKDHSQMGETLVLRCENHPETEVHVSSPEDFQNAPEGGCKLRCNARLDCGHTCRLFCHGYDPNHTEYQCREKCERLTCHQKLHKCSRLCHKDCGSCMVLLKIILPCGHTDQIPCSYDSSKWTCGQRCSKKLDCGHQCGNSCYMCWTTVRQGFRTSPENHSQNCVEEVEHLLVCGHKIKFRCHLKSEELLCSQPCRAKLDCGHDCPGTCGQCLGGRVHVACIAICGESLEGCQHKCPLPCGLKCLPCKEPCTYACAHSMCSRRCGEPCQPCEEKCPWNCVEHSERLNADRSSGQKVNDADRKAISGNNLLPRTHVDQPCDETCSNPCDPCPRRCENLLVCGHQCNGFCGEQCLCFECEGYRFVPLSSSGKVVQDSALVAEAEAAQMYGRCDETTNLIKLPACGHIFHTKPLDVFVEHHLQNSYTHPLACPSCHKAILDSACWRYHRKIQLRFSDRQKAKENFDDATTVARIRQEKLLRSAKLLSLLGTEAFPYLLCTELQSDTRVDVNRAFTLANQIKLLRVTELVMLATRTTRSKETSITTLQKVLINEKATTDQRCRELTEETRRQSYIALLQYLNVSQNPHILVRLQSCPTPAGSFAKVLQDRRQAGIPNELEVQKLIADNMKLSRSWAKCPIDTIFRILGASSDQDLCDIEESRSEREGPCNVRFA